MAKGALYSLFGELETVLGPYRCLSDSKLMASRSQFMPRKQDEKLQMEIEAFRFADESSDSVSNIWQIKYLMFAVNNVFKSNYIKNV